MILLTVISQAQSPTPANLAAQPPATPSPSPSVPIEPPSLIPPNILPPPGAESLPQMPGAPELEQLNALFKQSSLGKVADEARLHLQMAQLETRIRNDEDLRVARATADAMGTDLERRHRLKSYYHLYYDKLRSLATTPELKAYVDGQEAAHILLLLQPKVRHETDEGESKKVIAAAGTAAKALPTPVQIKAEQGVVKPRQ